MSVAGTDTMNDEVSASSLPKSRQLVDFFAFGLIAMQVVFVAWSTSTTWFKQDDFAELLLASRAGGFPGNVFQTYIGHLIPGTLTLYSLNHKLFGMNWSSVVVITAVMQLAASFLTWRVIRSIFGVRRFSLFLFVIYISSVLTFDTVMWWSTLTIYLPLQIAFPATLLLLQRFLRNPSRVNAALPALSLLVATLFFEKCLIIAPFLVALLAATPLVTTAPDTAKSRLKAAKLPILWLSVTTIVYGVFYQLLTRSSHERPQFELDRFAHFTLEPVLKVFFPSLFGGPSIFNELKTNAVFADPGPFEMWGALIGVALLVALSAYRFRTWARYWLILGVLLLINLAMLVAAGREWLVNPRYFSELTLPAIVLIGLAIHGGIRPDYRTTQGHRFPVDFRPGVLGVLGVVAAVSILGFSFRNSNDVRTTLQPAPAFSYTNAALKSSFAFHKPITLIRQYVSGDLINGVLLPGLNFTSTILKPSNGPWTFADAASDAYFVLEDGTVVPAGTSHETVPQYENGLCNIDLHDGVPKLLTMNGDPFPWTWYGSLTAATRSDVQITVDWNADPTTFTIPNGVSNTLFYIPGGGKTMTVTATGGDVCVTDLGFGNLVRDPFR